MVTKIVRPRKHSQWVSEENLRRIIGGRELKDEYMADGVRPVSLCLAMATGSIVVTIYG